ncbi:unnamed protein product, partial [Iphiclides podalirius]
MLLIFSPEEGARDLLKERNYTQRAAPDARVTSRQGGLVLAMAMTSPRRRSLQCACVACRTLAALPSRS